MSKLIECKEINTIDVEKLRKARSDLYKVSDTLEVKLQIKRIENILDVIEKYRNISDRELFNSKSYFNIKLDEARKMDLDKKFLYDGKPVGLVEVSILDTQNVIKQIEKIRKEQLFKISKRMEELGYNRESGSRISTDYAFKHMEVASEMNKDFYFRPRADESIVRRNKERQIAQKIKNNYGYHILKDVTNELNITSGRCLVKAKDLYSFLHFKRNSNDGRYCELDMLNIIVDKMYKENIESMTFRKLVESYNYIRVRKVRRSLLDNHVNPEVVNELSIFTNTKQEENDKITNIIKEAINNNINKGETNKNQVQAIADMIGNSMKKYGIK